MAKSGIRHIDVGAILARSEWESEESHELIHGNSFPGSPVERQLFYRDDLNTWYIYNGTSWVSLQAAAIAELDDIGDVNVPSPTDGHVLYWDDGASKWKDKAVVVGSQVIWKDASEAAMTDSNRTSTLTWTDLDLTAYTSANAKFAILRFYHKLDSINAGSGNNVNLSLRKNGTTPTHEVTIWFDGGGAEAGSRKYANVIVGLDAGQVCEYQIYIAGTIQVDTVIAVLGYIE